MLLLNPFSRDFKGLVNNLDESYTNEYQEHIAHSHGYKVICIEDGFSNPEQKYWVKKAIRKFMSKMLKGELRPSFNPVYMSDFC